MSGWKSGLGYQNPGVYLVEYLCEHIGGKAGFSIANVYPDEKTPSTISATTGMLGSATATTASAPRFHLLLVKTMVPTTNEIVLF
mgnify:CR=1 FL=1